ncbi:acetylglutamate kinase [Pseudothermotoga hypogea DSM 11164 = NBRC 106472]|uniref:Acetylglutamate kinase n=1 Tax=Pseudothermotoga hypogea DSM 11164 = NBRC 106472 TaxID=1123384 RepID=A0A0X1KQZ7_9THEM|nr:MULTISPECIES: acetylglutamate kinase [Pseudothermotoga]AJC73659.1 acetylglutamate kinase [Pseudothermotoga hypogea DSM 11164 = NBRC 106472]MDI6862878.1 acetylglutamate kinase [Pseudothermotoga sp.]
MGQDVVSNLFEVLPYLERFHGKTMLVKVGGNVLNDRKSKDCFARSITFLVCVGIKPLIVHGGGPEITTLMEKLGMKPTFRNGYRVTDEQTMEVVEMVLNKINKDLVATLNLSGVKAIGICGKDVNFLIAEKDTQYGDIGYVGKVKRINEDLVSWLFQAGYVPVIAPIGVGEDGTTYNLNADVAAAQIAIALKAEMIIFMTDVDGVMKDGRLVSQLDVEEALKLIQEGIVKAGMVPKLSCAVEAVKNGVKSARIINGNDPTALLATLFASGPIGTIVTNH